MSKYLARKVVTEDGSFDSQKEYRRWLDLKLMERGGVISGLDRQKRYRIEIGGHLICTYVADFTYSEDGIFVVEDVKSPVTKKLPAYRIKKKLMAAIFGIDIREV